MCFPAKAGIQTDYVVEMSPPIWTPAFAGEQLQHDVETHRDVATASSMIRSPSAASAGSTGGGPPVSIARATAR